MGGGVFHGASSLPNLSRFPYNNPPTLNMPTASGHSPIPSNIQTQTPPAVVGHYMLRKLRIDEPAKSSTVYVFIGVWGLW